MTKAGRPVRAHYLSGTHWDREWYRPFQDYRVLLIEVVDRVLDYLQDDPDFRYFHLDGQTCVLDDYLEVRPERRNELRSAITSRKLLIGPWYTMPDLFCPGDEALVRNLAIGKRICDEWGTSPMRVAFTCDMFGHPSQMPQIYNGFGLADCVLGRGTNEDTTAAFFDWEGADGSRVFTFKLQDPMGYGAMIYPRTAIEGLSFKTPTADAIRVEIAEADEPEQTREQIFQRELTRYVSHEQARGSGSLLALFDWIDHIEPSPNVGRFLDLIRQAQPGIEAEHSTLEAFFDEARQLHPEPPVKRGELREPSKNRSEYLYLIPNCVSARVGQKLANDACQNLLTKQVEPLLAVANRAGAALPRRFLDIGWKLLLLNHAHDTICGCSIDQVHKDMEYRFDQVRVLAGQLIAKALGHLCSRIGELAGNDQEFTLVLFNPGVRPLSRIVRTYIDFAPDYPSRFQEGFRTQERNSFRLYSSAGDELPYQIVAIEKGLEERSQYARTCFIGDGPFDRYHIELQADVPAGAYRRIRVAPSPKPVRTPGTLRTGLHSAENRFLRIQIQPDGLLTIEDKDNGNVYRNLLALESRGEIGDGWFHGHSVNDRVTLSAGAPVRISVEHDGPLSIRFRVDVDLSLPARYDWVEERPSDALVTMTVSHRISLHRDADSVEVETIVDNRAEDHRMQLLLPSGAGSAEHWLAHHPYDIVERPIAVDPVTADWQEAELVEKPFLDFQAVTDGKQGLAFVSAGGLHEGGVRDDRERSLQVTLLRSFRRTVGNVAEPGGLELGVRRFRYVLLPFAGALPVKRVFDELAWLQGGVLRAQSGPRSSGFPPLASAAPPGAGADPAPAERSWLRLEHGNLVLSAWKPADDDSGEWIVRVWNPLAEPASDRLVLNRTVRRVFRCNLDESVTEELPLSPDATVAIEALPGKKILTLRLAW